MERTTVHINAGHGYDVVVGSGLRSAVGNFLAGAIGIAARNSIGAILIGVGGACVVILLCRWLFK